MRNFKLKTKKLSPQNVLCKNLKLQNQLLKGESAALREELASKTYQSYLLYEINKAINTFLEPIDIAAMILQALVALTGAQASSIMLYNPESSSLEVVSHCGIEKIDEELAEFQFNFKDSRSWEVIQTKTPYIAKDVSDQEKTTPSLYDYILCVPMIYDKLVLGTINIHNMGQNYQLKEQHTEFINNLAGQAALTFQNSFMYSKLKHQAEILEKQAVTDGLTGLFNHITFQQRLTDEMGRSCRYDLPLSIILFDIDHFKKFNDTYGHQFGDEVLRKMTEVTNCSIRTVDIAARYGGEEFVIILPHTDLEGALTVAERIRENVAEHTFTNEAGTTQVKVTVSLGVAQLQHNQSKNDFIEAADQALYEAKHNGRNRVCTAKKG